MKKVVALLLVAVMALSVLAGCDKKEDTPSTPSTTDAPASNSNDSATPVKISLYRASFNTQTPDSAQEKKIQDKLNAYLKDKGFNIEIDYHEIGDHVLRQLVKIITNLFGKSFRGKKTGQRIFCKRHLLLLVLSLIINITKGTVHTHNPVGVIGFYTPL